jgi:hypothetical protein
MLILLKVFPNASEIRFLNKIKFPGYKAASPMPVAVVVSQLVVLALNQIKWLVSS